MTADHVLVARAQAGDRDAEAELLGRYRDVVRSECWDRFLPGGERDDLIQEALLGLLDAIRTYDVARGPFRPYARCAIRRQLIDAVKAANRLKHGPLNDSVRSRRGETEVSRLVDLLEAKDGDPHVALTAKQERANIVAAIAGLSELERRAVIGVMNGLSYAEIELGHHVPNYLPKTVDNALSRARSKLRQAA